jgi:hypothetical protein
VLGLRSKSLPWRTCQPVAPGCQLKEKATDSNDCTLIKAPLHSTDLTAEAGAIMCGGDHEVTSSIGDGLRNCQSPQFCSRIPPRGGYVGRLVHRFLPPRYEKTKQTQTDRGQNTRFLLKNRGACNKKQKEVVRLEVYIEG